MQENIVETAKHAGSFTTLVTAVDAAGLGDILAEAGPFTVFAPTDDAFAALPEGTIEGLLADPAKLGEILSYHVVPGRITAAEIGAYDQATTVQGGDLTISTNGGVTVNDANVIKADVEATNGVIHVIDRVLIPAA